MNQKDARHTPVRVLIVEDSKPIRSYLKNVVMDLHGDVAGEASNGNDGLERFRSLKPDLTLLDINMPGMDGRETLKRIMGEFPKARVVMLTSINDSATVLECIEAGALNYILKDSSKQELMAELKTAMECSRK